MAKEIERKFLVRDDSWRSLPVSQKSFRQAYILSGPDRSVRVRIVNEEHARLTIKIGTGKLVRDEYEYEIPVADALELAEAAEGIVIEKTRYDIPHAGFVWEVDVFGGPLAGLVIAEVEMSSEDDRPDLPPWLGEEVTSDRRYSNQMLAMSAIRAGGTDALED